MDKYDLTTDQPDAELLANAIESASSAIRLARPIKNLGTGFRSIIIRDANRQVYRIGRTEEVVSGYEHEATLLPLIHEQLPIPIPNPQLLRLSAEQFPGGVITYAELPGRMMTPNDATGNRWREFAIQLGEFLPALHRISLDIFQGIEFRPPITSTSELERIRAETSPGLKSQIGEVEIARLDRWWDELINSPEMQNYEPTLIHHDFWHDNILVDSEPLRISGIIDWEHSRPGDPAIDIAPLTYLGSEFANEVLEVYLDQSNLERGDFIYRLNQLTVLREFGGIRHSIFSDDEDGLTEGITKLRATRVFDDAPTGPF